MMEELASGKLQEPLIWTSRGNLPVSSLKREEGWIDNEKETTFFEQYILDGEIVRRSVHVFLKKGLDLGIKGGAFG